jgi:hypothetical protein
MMAAASSPRTPIREIGDNQSVHRWTTYKDVLPAEEYDEAFLLRMLNDESVREVEEGPLVWVPFHAWRALGQLGSLAVIEPLLTLADNDFYQQAYNDFARVAADIGEPAVEPLVAILADRSRPETSRTLAAQALGEIGRTATGSVRALIVDALMTQLRQNPSDGWINGMAAAALMAMEERSVGPEVLKMFDEGRIQGVVRQDELSEFFGSK